MSNDTEKNIIDFSQLKKTLQANREAKEELRVETEEVRNHEDMLHQGLDNFLNTLEEGVSGFVTISFKEDGVMPEVTIAGDIDPLRTIGALEYVSGSLSHQLQMERFAEVLGLQDGQGVELIVKPTNENTQEELPLDE